MPSDKIDLDAIRARADAATPGPWEMEVGDWAGDWAYASGPTYYSEETSSALRTADAVFVAHARADVPALLAEVDRLRDLVEQVTREKFREKTELRASHAEVLERLHADYNERINTLSVKLARHRRAVAAVRSIHHPSRPEFTDNYNYEGDYDTCPACTTDPHLVRWPCDTIKAIEEAIKP
ncbi:MAG TPA: hypothetical protein VHA75_18950 [Rugosimonospora sp.]|nr:hypothetical protein [Rugosimonospora sp.]